MSETIPNVTMEWKDYRGKPQTREVKQHIDIRDLEGTPVYPWLVMAANPHLSAPDLREFLEMQSGEHPAVYRPLHWIQRRRWMCLPAGTAPAANYRDRDGKQAGAAAIMAAHPGLSLRDLTELLRDHGIHRSREWVRRQRYAAV